MKPARFRSCPHWKESKLENFLTSLFFFFFCGVELSDLKRHPQILPNFYLSELKEALDSSFKPIDTFRLLISYQLYLMYHPLHFASIRSLVPFVSSYCISVLYVLSWVNCNFLYRTNHLVSVISFVSSVSASINCILLRYHGSRCRVTLNAPHESHDFIF